MTPVGPALPGRGRQIGTRPARYLLAALLLVVCLGAALRVFKLGAESLWLDEAYSIQVAHRPLGGIVQEISRDVHPPLYYFALHYWMALFGDSEFAARLLSAIFGILAIPLIYKIAALLFDRATGLFSAAILAWSHFNIEFSQETRMYSLLCLLSLASLYFFLKLLENGTRRLTVAGYIASTALLAYTHIYGLFIIAAEALYLLLLAFTSRRVFRQALWRWLFSQAMVLLLFSPWLAVLARQVRTHNQFWIPKPTLYEFGYTWLRFAGSLPLVMILAPLAALPIVWLAAGGRLAFFLRQGGDEQPDLPLTSGERVCFVLVWLASLLLVPFVASYLVTPFYLAKYALPASLAFIVLAARGITLLRWPAVRALLLIAVLVLAQQDIGRYWNTIKKDQWREALAFFNQAARPNDLVLFTEPAGAIPFDYYLRRGGIRERLFPDYKVTAANAAEMLKPEVEGHDRVWVVLSHQNELSQLTPRQMSEWYDVAAHQTLPGVEMYLFAKK